jgi:hypothetical protein
MQKIDRARGYDALLIDTRGKTDMSIDFDLDVHI